MRKVFGTSVGVFLVAGAAASCATPAPRGGSLAATADSLAFAVVTAREAVFDFPVVAELSGPWPAAADVKWPLGYAWGVQTYGYEHPVVLNHMVQPDEARRLPAFASLDAALRAGSLRACHLDMFWWCAVQVRGTARAEGRRAVLRLRDSTLVAALRAHRPRIAVFTIHRLDRRVLLDSAVIEYADP